MTEKLLALPLMLPLARSPSKPLPSPRFAATPPLSSGLIMGSSAFFTKPGESIAPMLGWAIIHGGGGRREGWAGAEGDAHGAAGSGDHLSPSWGGASGSEHAARFGGFVEGLDRPTLLFYLLVLGPFAIASLQLFLWSQVGLEPCRVLCVRARACTFLFRLASSLWRVARRDAGGMEPASECVARPPAAR